jgi:hypothetical protein
LVYDPDTRVHTVSGSIRNSQDPLLLGHRAPESARLLRALFVFHGAVQLLVQLAIGRGSMLGCTARIRGSDRAKRSLQTEIRSGREEGEDNGEETGGNVRERREENQNQNQNQNQNHQKKKKKLEEEDDEEGSYKERKPK